MKKIIAIISLFIVFSGCAIVKNIIHPDPPFETLKFKDITIKTDNGDYIFKNISVDPSYDFATVSFDLFNNTKYDCINTFDIQLIGKGSIEQSKLLSVKKGATLPVIIEFDSNLNNEQITDIKIRLDQQNSNFENKNLQADIPVNYTLVLQKPVFNQNNSFSDKSFSIVFDITKSEIAFDIVNKTNGMIRLNWDNFSFVDITGSAHRVIHTGIKYIDAEKPQAPTIIPPGSRISDFLYPSDYIINLSPGWAKLPLLPEKKSDSGIFIGKNISLFMPIEIDGVVKNYNFVFKIAGVK